MYFNGVSLFLTILQQLRAKPVQRTDFKTVLTFSLLRLHNCKNRAQVEKSLKYPMNEIYMLSKRKIKMIILYFAGILNVFNHAQNTKQWFSTSRSSQANKVNNVLCSPEHMCACSKDRKTGRGCISSRALLSSHGSGPHISAGYRAELFWCDSIVRSGWLNAVPSQHCSLEALKHFGDKHRLAVKRATEEKAYQMSSQWAVSCIMKPGPQIRWKFEARGCTAPSQALLCDRAPVPAAAWNSAGGFSSPLLSSSIQQWEIRAQREREEREGKEGEFGFSYSPCPLFLLCFLGVGVRVRTMAKKMVPNQPLNGNTVGGSASFKARPGHIVLQDRRRRMEFAGGCQKVSSLCERTDPLFTALYRARAPFVLLLSSLCTASFFSLCCSGSAADGFPQSERLRRGATSTPPLCPKQGVPGTYSYHPPLHHYHHNHHQHLVSHPHPCQKENL